MIPNAPAKKTEAFVRFQTIRATVEDALNDDLALQKKALRAFIYARRWHTPAYQAGYILQMTELHRAGERGYDVSQVG